MKPLKNQLRQTRIANFSSIDLPAVHLLNFDSEDIETITKKIRSCADLPYVYIVSREHADRAAGVISALKAIRSPCYPYAVFLINGANLNTDDADMDIVNINSRDAAWITDRINEYVLDRFCFDKNKLRVNNSGSMPSKIDVAIIGAGVTGLYAANRLKDVGISFIIIEKRDMVGGIWSRYANDTSQVNTSEGAYRLIEKHSRSNRDHSATNEILEDIAQLAQQVSNQLFMGTKVDRIEKYGGQYRIWSNREGKAFVLESKGIILAINDRVGTPRKAEWKNQSLFEGEITSGISGEAKDLDWRDKNVVIVGMGAFAIENARTALEGGAHHVSVICRRHGTVCPKIIDYLNFATPYDEAFQHDKKSNLRNMMYWKKQYELSGATQPECWMGKIKHEGHTISVSDIWFIAHYLKKIKTIVGKVTGMTPKGVVVDHHHHVDADIVINCIGFERNASAAKALSGYPQIYNNNYFDKNFIYLADAFIDNGAFNSFFGSSVLEMVKFYMEVFIMFFDSPEYESMMSVEGIEKVPIENRKWAHYIYGAMTLIRNYPALRATAKKQIDQRTNNFLESHDLATYIAENKREWLDTHAMLAGKPLREEDCLPYVFEKILPP